MVAVRSSGLQLLSAIMKEMGKQELQLILCQIFPTIYYAYQTKRGLTMLKLWAEAHP